MPSQLRVKSYVLVYIMGFLTALSSFVASYSHVFLSQLERVIKAKDDLSSLDISIVLTILVSAAFVGQIIGPFMYKPLIQKYGESGTMIRCYLVIIIAILIQLIDLRVSFLLASRLLFGVITGIQGCILPLYLNSLAPISLSGKLGSMNQLLICYGVIAAYLLGFTMSVDKDDEISWRLLVGFPIIPSILSIISLKWLFPYDSIERHFNKKQIDRVQCYANQIYQNATVTDIENEKTCVSNKTLNTYKKEYKRYSLALIVAASCQLSGVNSIFYYARQLFQDITDNDELLSQKLMVGLAFCQLVSCSYAGKFIDSFGRRYLILRGQLFLIFILGIMFLVDFSFISISKQVTHYLLISLIYIHIIAFNFTLGPVCILYAAQLVTNITPIIVTKRIVSLVVAMSTNFMIKRFGIGPLFLLYGVLTLVSYTYLKDRIRQTKGKSKLQIFQMFQGHMKESQPDENMLMI